MSQTREIAALAEIQRHSPTATLFTYLKPGERFRFIGRDMVNVKGKSGWYRSEATGKAWRTGRHVGVERIPQPGATR